MDVKNKIILVTGASSGFGLASAKLLTERGAKLALISHSKKSWSNYQRSFLYR